MAGETTATTALNAPFEIPAGLFLVPFTVSFATTQLETADVVECGYTPASGTIYGVIYSPTDMDTNVSPALVQKVTVGSTDIVTGLTGGQTGTKSFVGCVPLALTAKAKVSITSTTAAGTAAAGTVYLQLLCQK
jgi:hypothetical protein